jgi:hypothetical protein
MTPTFGRITASEFERRSALARQLWPPRKAEEHIAVLRLLTDTPASRGRIAASAAAADAAAGEDGEDEFETEYAHLWPGAAAQRHEAKRIAASRGLDGDELYEAIFPGEA